jgi:hypothetical protein
MFRKMLIAVCAICFIFAIAPASMAQEAAQAQSQRNTPKLRGYHVVKPAPMDTETMQSQLATAAAKGAASLPLWTFNVEASRDQNDYTGVMVGTSPFTNPASTTVPTHVVPVIIVTNTVGVSFNSTTGIIGTAPGITTFDPTARDNSCLAKPNNIPVKLLKESPIFSPALFDFGGTIVGTTIYSDAFQRGNFWQVLGDNGDDYHVLLNPIFHGAIVINVPAQFSTTLPAADFPACGPMGIVDINWFDTYITTNVLPALKAVNPSNFPLFMLYNVVLASPVTNLNTCCVLGYHGATGFPIQTYSPADFDTTGLFGQGTEDTAVLSHEVDEWMNDPFGNNRTPRWGHTGQVSGCQGNLEVGDPLSGTDAPPIVMPNGYTYHLQELAFFSWFFGAPSVGIHGWFSDNGTFLTDAGPVCTTTGASTGGQ